MNVSKSVFEKPMVQTIIGQAEAVTVKISVKRRDHSPVAQSLRVGSIL